jgi:hypothetical protein
VSDVLRQELEAVLEKAAAAVREGDVEAFLEAVQPPAPGLEEAMRADFERARGMFGQMIPAPAQTIFVAARAEGDGLAAYYHLRLAPYAEGQAQILLSAFVRVEGAWRLLLRGTVHGFEFEPETDFVAKARRLTETEPGLQLRPPTNDA